MLAETIISNESIQKYKVILGILQRRMVINVSPEDGGSSQARHRARGRLTRACACCGCD